MSINSRIVIAVACCPLLTSAQNADATKYRTKHHRHSVAKPYNPTPRQATEIGGWRKRDNAKGWDNTCFNLRYLSSQFACSTSGGDGQ
jgi:hypothetical protein